MHTATTRPNQPPHYTPEFLTPAMAESRFGLKLATVVNRPTEPDSVVEKYLVVYLAGNLIESTRHIPCKNAYRQQARHHRLQRFRKALKWMEKHGKLNRHFLLRLQKLLVTHPDKQGYRKKPVRVGNPTGPTVFYGPKASACRPLLENLLELISCPSLPAMTRALAFYTHFTLIHPFPDGNGRLSRIVCLHILKAEYNPAFCYLLVLYFRVINRGGFFLAAHAYQQERITPLQTYFRTALCWACEAARHVGHHIPAPENTTLAAKSPAATSRWLDFYIQTETRTHAVSMPAANPLLTRKQP